MAHDHYELPNKKADEDNIENDLRWDLNDLGRATPYIIRVFLVDELVIFQKIE